MKIMKRIKSARGGSAPGRKVIIFDLDDTLIDTDRIRSNIVKLAQNLGVSKKNALVARAKVRSFSNPFVIENYAKFLFPRDAKKRKSLIRNFNRMFVKHAGFNYEGVNNFLRDLNKKYLLILLTYGNNKFQKKKIAQSGFSRFFKDIIITPDNTKLAPVVSLIRKYGTEMLFIDNAKATCDAACELGLPFVWVTSANKNSSYFKKLASRIKKVH